MENALTDFLSATLVPILRAYVSACATGYIHLILVFVPAFRALPDEFAVFALAFDWLLHSARLYHIGGDFPLCKGGLVYNGHVVNRIYKYGKFVWPGLVFILGLILLAVGLGRDADAAASLFGSLPAIVVTLVSVIAPFPFFVFIGMAGSLIGVAVRGKHERLPWYSYLIATAVSIASGILFGYLVLVEYLDSALLSYALGAVVVLLVALPFMLLEKDVSGELPVRLASAVLVPSVLALALLFTLRPATPWKTSP